MVGTMCCACRLQNRGTGGDSQCVDAIMEQDLNQSTT